MRARAAAALVLGLGVLAVSTPAGADLADAMRPALHVYRDRDGLPQNSAMALAFAKDGSLWVGTQDGIASFDGTTWTQATLPRAEVSGFVRTLVVDHEGALWVGRQDGGLARLREGAWSTFDAAEGLPSPRVDSLAEADEPGGGHTLWAGTHEGLARFEGGAWHGFVDGGGLPSEHVTKVLPGTDDDGAPVLWVGTDGGLAVVRDGHASPVAGAPRGTVLALLQTKGADGAPELWVGGSRMPLGRRTHGAWTWIESPSIPRADVYALAATVAPDRTRVVWVGTDDGVVRLEHDRWIALPDDVLPSRFVWSFGVPPSAGPTSDLWIGSDTGLARVHTGGWSSVDRTLGLPQDSVYASLVTEGPHGEDELWVGTRDGGLSRFAGGRWQRFGAAEGFHAQTVFALAQHVESDGTHHVYVGSQDAGLLRFDGDGFTSIAPGHVVRHLTESTGEDGNPELWAALGDGSGVLHHVGTAWLPITRASGAPFDEIFATATSRSPEGHTVLWVATQGAGLARLEDGAWTTFDRASGALPTDSVPSVFVEHRADGHQEVWAGAEGGGVSRLDLDTPGAPWRTLSPATRPAIPDGTVYQVVADAQGRIYLTTNKGVARLTRRDAEDADFVVETFTTEDGLPANECNGGASEVDGRGRIWVGTIAGLAMFDPSREVPSPAPQLRVGARYAGSLRALLPGETLDYDEASPSFDATLVSLFRGAETRYRTQVVGL
ncbi:MAG TPA: two-component regulator propeller domain-containing protein, partial [Polyangiaceae bacterium]